MSIFNRRKPASDTTDSARQSPATGPRPGTGGAESSRPARRAVPNDIASKMEIVGRHALGASSSSDVDHLYIWSNVLEPFAALSQANPLGLTRMLADAVLPVGGWAVLGAERAIVDLIGSPSEDPSFDAIMTAALDFLRHRGVPNSRVTGYEWSFWSAHKGEVESWLQPRVVPSADATGIRDLSLGEVRRIAQLDSADDSNAILVRMDASGMCVSMIDAKWSDDGPDRSQSDWKQAASLHDLYADVGASLQIPPYWFDRELAPYLPFSKPDLS